MPTTPKQQCSRLPADPITVGQAAARIGVTRAWCRRLVQRGEIRATRTPLGWLVDAADVERYRAARAGEERRRCLP